MRRVHVLMKGTVQGVFFRRNTLELAQKLNLKGWVKNVPKGVEAIFEGEDEKIKDMLEFCAIGPEGAKVTTIDVTEETYTGEFDSFERLN